MEYSYWEKPDERLISHIVFAWQEAFGDEEEYIRSFISSSFYRGCFFAADGDRAVSFVHLTSPTEDERFVYGYGVSTLKEYRGRGLCRELHKRIFATCLEKYSVYGVHPASEGLADLYRSMGMKPSSYRYYSLVEGDGGKYYPISTGEYSFMRSVYSEGVSGEWLSAGEYVTVGFELEGTECAACLSDGVIVELLAPPQLEGMAARRVASVYGRARLMSLCDSPVGAECALMTYNGYKTDFSLFNE